MFVWMILHILHSTYGIDQGLNEWMKEGWNRMNACTCFFWIKWIQNTLESLFIRYCCWSVCMLAFGLLAWQQWDWMELLFVFGGGSDKSMYLESYLFANLNTCHLKWCGHVIVRVFYCTHPLPPSFDFLLFGFLIKNKSSWHPGWVEMITICVCVWVCVCVGS